MTDEELRELRQLLLITSAFGMKAAMVKWISSVLERRLAAAQAAGPIVVDQSRRGMQRVAKASVAVTRSAFRKGG